VTGLKRADKSWQVRKTCCPPGNHTEFPDSREFLNFSIDLRTLRDRVLSFSISAVDSYFLRAAEPATHERTVSRSEISLQHARKPLPIAWLSLRCLASFLPCCHPAGICLARQR
jgi:hypothetical protein